MRCRCPLRFRLHFQAGDASIQRVGFTRNRQDDTSGNQGSTFVYWQTTKKVGYREVTWFSGFKLDRLQISLAVSWFAVVQSQCFRYPDVACSNKETDTTIKA